MSALSTPRYLLYRLRLESPLIISRRQGDPNSAGTHPYIAGSAIRGVVAQRLLSGGVRAEDDEFLQLVLSGRVRYLNAYPEIEGARSMPVPLSWRVMKDAPERGWDLVYFPAGETAATEDSTESSWPQEQLQSPFGSFVCPGMVSGLWVAATPEVAVRIHHQRDRARGRAWKDQNDTAHGAIYTYEFLEPDQVFHGVIQLMPGAENWETRLRELFASPIVLGRSRRAGYGGDAQVEFLSILTREYAAASALLDRDLHEGERFRILLVSPAIVRHPQTGQIDPAAIDEEIRRVIGRPIAIERRRWAFETAGGFNQKWGLELPQACAVRAGSVLVVKAYEPIPRDKLFELEHEGIGERRTEGFGRLVLLEYDVEEGKTILLARSTRPRSNGAVRTELDPESRRLLDLLEQRIVLEAAETELRRAAWRLAEEAENIPANSLLGRIRTLLREGHDRQKAASALSELRTWVQEWRSSQKRAGEQLRACRWDGKSLLEWLNDLLVAEGGALWQALERSVGERAQLRAVSQRRYLRSPQTAQSILENHAALLCTAFLDEFMGALTHKNRGR